MLLQEADQLSRELTLIIQRLELAKWTACAAASLQQYKHLASKWELLSNQVLSDQGLLVPTLHLAH